jgi:hypothetical protein
MLAAAPPEEVEKEEGGALVLQELAVSEEGVE